MSRNRRYKKKLKNMATTVVTLLLIIGVSVGVTWALLWGKSNVKENVFTGSKGVDVVLSEVKWDGSTAENKGQAETNPGEDKGIKIAEKYVPGLNIPKDPKLTNLSDDEEVWVMLRVQYEIQAGADASSLNYIPVKKDQFNKIAKTQTGTSAPFSDGVNSNWIATIANNTDPVIKAGDDISGTDGSCYSYYYYKTKLGKKDAANAATDNLFDNIKILDSEGSSKISLEAATGDKAEEKRYKITAANTSVNSDTYYTYAILPAFKIKVEGAAISVEEGDPADLGTGNNGTKRSKDKIISELQGVFAKSGSSGN